MKEQKYLRKGGLLAFVAVLGMAPPLSTDMYMPSLPAMAEEFNTSTIAVNLTLVVFFLFMAIGMLLFGPVSDKYGRKLPLITGLAFYAAGSIGCAVSPVISIMIIARCIEALGAGAMVSISIAIIKDSFSGKLRDNAIAIVQSLSVIAPIASPVIGAMILKFASWRMVFIILTAIAIACIIAGILFQESIAPEEKTDGTVTDSIKQMAVIGKNPNFTPFLLAASVYSAPFMAYLAVASYMYEGYFGLSATQFSIFFAVNAAFSVLGPMSYIYVNGRVKPKNIMWGLIGIAMVFSLLIAFLGHISPVIFLCCFIPYGITNSFMRPYSTAILLEQQEGDTGSASALLNFCNTLFGSLGMLMGSLNWPTYIFGLSATMISFTVIAAAIWMLILKSSKIKMKKL